MMEELYKYPRTRHLEGSRKQAGDEDLNYVRFGESDIFDKEEKRFFSTAKRREILKGAGFVHSVLVLDQGRYENPDQITSWIGPSHFISSDPKKNLEEQCRKGSARLEETFLQTDLRGLMEGIYIKVEEGDYVLDRLKYVRPTFLNAILDSESHWMNRPLVANKLADGADLFL